ncbi:MAG: hypothetical protein IJI38_08300, partial [Clostridia bacterium]|nr:hypothetical protein [Clostridia bacterium]
LFLPAVLPGCAYQHMVYFAALCCLFLLFPGFLRLRAWDAAGDHEKKKPGSASWMKSGRA